ncbi:glycosyl glycerophosphate transferase [Levilactobacillus paucivorans]|uniref:Glycosyl glycerophosphate transferase n=1 Tax=Levilactobacillus paucivorans TaxID=616990 RepID=A0A0R2LH81_9LACO|nr:glycosyl glycerophosphate transferase [Levilactobacillus paucivorans]
MELELINVPEPFATLTVTFFERQTQATLTVPVTRMVNQHVVRVAFNPMDLQFEQGGRRDFSWELYLNVAQSTMHGVIQIESEALSDRWQTSQTSSCQLRCDAAGMAILNSHTHQSATEVQVTAINLVDDQLQVVGTRQVNPEPLVQQRLVLKDKSDQHVIVGPVVQDTRQGLVTLSLPLAELPLDTPQVLYIRTTVGEETVERRVVLARSLAGQTTELVTHQHRLVMLDKRFDNALLVTASVAPSLPQRVVNAVGQLRQVVKWVAQLADKVNLTYLSRLFRHGHTPYERPTLIFESFGGRQVSDSPYAIYRLFTRLYPEFNCVWSINRSQRHFCRQHDIPYVIRRTTRWVRLLGKASFWISNARFPLWIKKPDYLTYIQTWHGTPLKKLGLDIEKVTMPGTTTARYHANFVKEANRWDALISPNDYSTQVFRTAFGFNNQILKVGYPRNDALVNSTPAEITALKRKLGIPLDKRVVLYAPTYRDNQFAEKGKYTFDLPFSLAEFQQRFGKDTVLILRMHYLIANTLDIRGYEGVVFDFSRHPNISELYLVSDLLITDYSSVFFDYAYLKRPILFYPYDYQVYKDELRGFYLNYETELPGEIAHDESQLLSLISQKLATPDMSHDARFMAFYRRFCAIDDGQSSWKVVAYILQQIENHG